MSLIFSRAIRIANVLTDADSTPTISIIRTDTNATVQASTDMTHDSTGRYSFTLASPVAGVTYRASYSIVVNGQTISSSSEQTVIADFASWYHDDEDGVALAMGETDLDIESDIEATNTRNHAVIQADGEASDAIVNGMLAASDIETIPVVQADVKDYIWKLLQLGSRYITAGLLIGHRAWYGLDRAPQDKLSGWATAFENKGRKFVSDAIAALEGTAGSDTEEESVVAVQAIVPTREQGCGYPWGWM